MRNALRRSVDAFPSTLVPSSMAVLFAASFVLGCANGHIGGEDADVLQRAGQAVRSGARRLSRVEYDTTLRDLLDDHSNSGFAELPEDTTDPFDNDYTTQLTSPALIEAAETLATEAAKRALSNAAVHDKILPCKPTGPGDTACLRTFITTFGRRALRRSLSNDEVAQYLALQAYSIEANDFDTGVELVIRAMLQDVEFLYRIEQGTPVDGAPGVFKLNDYEVASRLSYFLWGTTPSDDLLDLADAHQLSNPDQIRAAAATMMADARARERVDRFHALWLSYHLLPHTPAMNAEMQAETNALVNRVVFDDPQDYLNLFTFDETFVNDDLAMLYGLPPPGTTTGAWVSYAGTKRKGILSQGSVLSAGTKFTDTSPTQRGKFIRNRLLCQEIPPPPPTVKSDQPPTDSTATCKIDRYEQHATDGSCKACHSKMDPVGFGLENYDKQGAYRDYDIGLPQCTITGDGELEPYGTFNGPAGLADKLLASGALEACIVTQLYRFAVGRRERYEDAQGITTLQQRFKDDAHAFDQLMIEIAGSDGFGFRKEEE